MSRRTSGCRENIYSRLVKPMNYAKSTELVANYVTECAAEATGRPLILLTIADIGLDENRIDTQMTKWFSLAERWEAILLIDEADIFLERRRGADIARNGLVSGEYHTPSSG